MNSILKRIRDQINPFDGGKTFNSPQQRQSPMINLGKPMQNNNSQPIVGQAQVPFTQETADRYNANPQQFVGKDAIDPKYFGYPADDSASPYMYEDQSFQGSPYLLQPTNPGYTFYEDNTFSTPQQYPNSRLRKLLGR